MISATNNTCVGVSQLLVPPLRQEGYPCSVPQVQGDLAPDRAVILERSARPTLLGIDMDIRIRILDLILLNCTRRVTEDGRWMCVDLEIDSAVQYIRNIALGSPLPRIKRTYTILPGLAGRDYRGLLGSIASVQILQVCRQLLDEGVAILCGKNRFAVARYGALSSSVPNMIGMSNMALIKKLEMGLLVVMRLDLNSGPGSHKFTESLSRKLPALCELKITSGFCPHYTRVYIDYAH
jgi:hypothetical protein